MGTPAFTTDLTSLSTCDSTSGWTIVGMGGIDTEIKVQGSGCLYIEAKSTNALQGAMLSISSHDFSGSDRLFMWLFLASQGFLYSKAAGGVSIRAEDSNGYWAEWDIGGNDTPWCGQGWKRIVQDLNQTPDETGGGGTFDPSITVKVGFSCWYTAQLKGAAAAVDAVHYGTYLEITGGTSGDPLTLDDIVAGDLANNAYGFIYKNKSLVFELCSKIILGDQSGALNTYFKTTNEILTWQDQFIPADESKISLAEDSGTTEVFFGESSGSGEPEVGFAGSVMYAQQDIWGLSYALDFLTAITSLGLFASTFLNGNDGISFGSATGHKVKGCSFIDCGQIIAGAVIIRDTIISQTFAISALLWNGSIDIQRCKFLVNTGVNVHAIEHPANGSYNYIGLSFAGNDYDIEYSEDGGSNDLTINADPTSNPSTYEITGTTGGTVIILSPTSLTLTGLPSNTEVTIVKVSDGSELYHIENSSGDVVYNYGAGEQGLNVDVLIHHINYDPNIGNLLSYILPSVNTSLPVALILDQTYYNP